MPMFELPARGQDHRIIGIWHIIGGNQICWGKARAPIQPREAITKDDGLARICGRERWVGNRILVFETLPADIVKGFHGQLHLS